MRAAVIADVPVMAAMEGHHSAVPFLLTRGMFGGVPVEIAGGELSDKVGKPVADLHSHPCPEVYLLISPEPGDAAIEVEVEGERFDLESPAVAYIPANALHRFVTRRAKPGSFCLGVLLDPAGDAAAGRDR
ncbi:MAG TPA: hypothetical protein VF712_01750 [Thermoleophilaceae bacterium]